MMEKMRPEEFDRVFALMKTSFPANEYRPYDAQKALLEKPCYEIDVLRSKTGQVIALMAAWNLGAYAFVEHLAVDPACRNGGLGAKMLRQAANSFQKPLCLEVELPETELAARRIGFYQRNGFFLNEYPYVQPALAADRQPIPLRIMTSGGPIYRAEFEGLKMKIYTTVYNIHD